MLSVDPTRRERVFGATGVQPVYTTALTSTTRVRAAGGEERPQGSARDIFKAPLGSSAFAAFGAAFHLIFGITDTFRFYFLDLFWMCFSSS